MDACASDAWKSAWDASSNIVTLIQVIRLIRNLYAARALNDCSTVGGTTNGSRRGNLVGMTNEMPGPALIEQAEIQQILRWINDIEDAVRLIKKEPEDAEEIVQRCRAILRTIEKMKAFLIVIRD